MWANGTQQQQKATQTQLKIGKKNIFPLVLELAALKNESQKCTKQRMSKKPTTLYLIYKIVLGAARTSIAFGMCVCVAMVQSIKTPSTLP